MTDVAGRLFVFAAPSGAGKTTLVHAMLERHANLRFSVSYTTRPQRKNETDGVNYFFVSQSQFEALRAQGELLEWATVFDHFYGTSRSQVEKILARGDNVLLEIDWQGARQVRSSMPDCVTVFILPPSLAELERRLRDRRTDTEAVIARRLRDARSDMLHWQEFDFVIINDSLEQAVAELDAVFAGRGKAQATSNPALQARVQAILGV